MHLHLSGRKIFLFGFIAVLLIGIPVTIYLVQQQQDNRSKAEKSTNLSFSPDSSTASPMQKTVGDTIPLDIIVEPGSNIVTLVELDIQYDPEKLATASASAFVPNSEVFPIVMKGGPVYTPGRISVTLSVGPDPTKALQSQAVAGTVNFTALASTPAGTPTLVSYGVNTKARSTGDNDQFAEDVFSTGIPAAIAIGGETPTETPPTPVPPTPVPTTPIVPTLAPEPTVSASPSGQPVCSSLSVDRSPSGEPPLTLTFTANGSDSDGVINKVTFNFGDGQVSDETSTASGGIGTASVNVPVSHTYNNAGTFTASALLTDDNSLISSSTSCKQTITVSAAISPSPVLTNAPVTPAVTPPIAGSTEVALGIGAVVLLFVIGGGFLFFFI